MADRREINHQWYQFFDAERMVITLKDEDETELPAVYGVCGTCEGRGSHVNPSIDSHGISGEEFDEDPEFAESYRRGDYDQPCNECGGNRVVPEVDMDRLTQDERALVEREIDSHYQYQAEIEAERRFGC